MSVLARGGNASGLLATGSATTGALAGTASRITATNTAITTTGAGAAVRASSAGQVTLTSASATTSGANAFGLVASDAGSSVTATDTRISTTGTSAYGAFAQSGGAVALTGGSVTTSNSSALGLYSLGAGSSITATGTQIATSGANAHGIYVQSGGLVTTSGVSVTATGAGSSALFMAGPAGATQTANVTGSTLSSSAAPAINIAGGLANVTLTGSTVSGNGVWLNVVDDLSPGVLNLTADASTLTGAALRASISNVTLRNSTLWNLTGNSNVTSLTNDGSRILFSGPAGDPAQLASYKTLTAVNYIGAGGTLGLNSFLGGDGSPSDRLIIDGGSATGSSVLSVTKAGGPGDLTTGNGILVVDAVNGGTTATGAFALSTPYIPAGPYAYTLFRSSVDAAGPQSWYLRSTLNCALAPSAGVCPQPPGPGPGPGPGPTPPVPNFRPETSLYAALPAMTLLYGRSLLDTRHERVGDERQASSAGLGWGRILGQHGERDGSPGGIFGSGPAYDYDLFAFQAGLDLYRVMRPDGSRDQAGIYGAIGQIEGDVTHFDRSRAGKNSTDAYTLGAYWTHFGASGWYLDALAQATRYDAKAKSAQIPGLGLSTDGFGFATSLEGGYPIQLGAGLVLEPQVQLVYQTVRLDSASDGAAQVRFRDVDSLAGRIGARLARTWSLGEPQAGQPRYLTAWLRANLWQEFLGNPKTEFSAATGFVPFRATLRGTTAELNAGADAQLTRNLALYANVGYQFSLDGRDHAYNGKLGARITW